eukprot:COSAG04_NODE_18725_length_434_cov_0.614925_2_plen_23_part_01
MQIAAEFPPPVSSTMYPPYSTSA